MSLRLYLVTKAIRSGSTLDEAVAEVTEYGLANPDLDLRAEQTWSEWEDTDAAG